MALGWVGEQGRDTVRTGQGVFVSMREGETDRQIEEKGKEKGNK